MADKNIPTLRTLARTKHTESGGGEIEEMENIVGKELVEEEEEEQFDDEESDGEESVMRPPTDMTSHMVDKIEGCRLRFGVIQFLTQFVGDAKPRWESMHNFDDLENGNDWKSHWHVKDYKKNNKKQWQKIFKRYRLNLGPNKPDDPDFRERYTAPPKRRPANRRRSSESSSSPPPPPRHRVLPPPIPFVDTYESIEVPKGTRLAQIQQERDRRIRARRGGRKPKIQKTQFESEEAKAAKRAARTTVAVLRDERGWTRFRSHRFTAERFQNDPGYSEDVENQNQRIRESDSASQVPPDIEDWDSEGDDENEEDEAEGRKELWEMPQDQSTISRISSAIETKRWSLVEDFIKTGSQVHNLLFRRLNLVDEICSNNIPEEYQNLFGLLAQRGADIRAAYIDERTPNRLKRIEERDLYLDLIRQSISDGIKEIYLKSINSHFPIITFPGNWDGRILSIQRSSFRIEELEDKKYAFVIVAMEWDGKTFQVRQDLPLLTLRLNQEKIPIECHETPLTEYPTHYSIHPKRGKNEFEIHLKQRMTGFVAVWPILVDEELSSEGEEDSRSDGCSTM